jgi:hypothetical protein
VAHAIDRIAGVDCARIAVIELGGYARQAVATAVACFIAIAGVAVGARCAVGEGNVTDPPPLVAAVDCAKEVIVDVDRGMKDACNWIAGVGGASIVVAYVD